jgi:glutathione S-transferase
VVCLITIPISHYCEKARWALDRAAIDYREERHVQVIHSFAARRAGGGATVPVLVTPERVIGESQEILRWVDTQASESSHLFPADSVVCEEVESLCARFDAVLGPRARRLIYIHMFKLRELSLEFNNQGVPEWEDRALRLGWPLARHMVGHVLGIEPGIEVEDEAAVFAELDFVAGLLADGRAHLCGEHFSAADLTFAALAAAVLAPPQYGIRLPQPDVLPPHTSALIERAREHPAGRYALETFAAHRRRALAVV